MTDQGAAWTNWASGVLQGIEAPADAANFASLWNWSVKESGADVMRWNNPLNTTEPEVGAATENAVGVKAYPSVFDGIQATVATLLNGFYPHIVANLRGSIPHQQWQNAASDLETWSGDRTGAYLNWLAWTLPPPSLPPSPAPEVLIMDAEVAAALQSIKNEVRKDSLMIAALVLGNFLTDAQLNQLWGTVAADDSTIMAALADFRQKKP